MHLFKDHKISYWSSVGKAKSSFTSSGPLTTRKTLIVIVSTEILYASSYAEKSLRYSWDLMLLFVCVQFLWSC